MNLPNDNQERYSLINLKHHKFGIRNCATCLLKTEYFYKMGRLARGEKLTGLENNKLRRKIDNTPIRDCHIHQYLCEYSDCIWKRLLAGKARKAKHLPICHDFDVSKDELKFIGNEGPVYAHNVQWQSCLLYNVMDYQIRNEIVTPITVSWFEVLHSVYKGVVEFNFRMIMASIHLCVKNNIGGVNRDAIGLIDTRVKNFQCNQSYQLFGTKSVIVHKGFSPCFKDTKTTSNALSKAIITGGNIDANRFAVYLFYLLMSIGTDGSVLPNRNIKIQIPPNGEFIVINPTKAVIESATAVLELVTLHKGDLFSDLIDLPKLRYCTHVANARTKTLFLLKQGLGGYQGEADEFYNIKLHGCIHSDQAIMMTGEPSKFL
jgi:hypothetical protein